MEYSGVRILFSEDGAEFDWTAPVTGFDCTVQCVLVNIGTSLESDLIFPDRGTRLLTAGLVGKLFSNNQAVHESNFAAAQSKNFVEENTPVEITERIQRVRIEPIVLTRNRLETNVVIETNTGKLIGREITA